MSDDLLRGLRDRLDRLDEIPLEDRAELFEQTHRALVAELNALEEV